VAGTGGPSGLGAGGVGESEASASAPTSSGDPLVENGLGSPLCGVRGELSPASRANCATSGFEAAGAPTGDYALDVHIDTGLLGLTLQTALQDYLIGPVWMGLVWIAHTLVVALEWCFTLDLLDSSALADLERSLRATRAAFTGPWLVLALALASLMAAYNGLVRRRVADTLGQAALMLAMMAAGLWVIADPTGTVGALGRWVDEASAGTVGAVADGSPAHAPRALADNLGALFVGVVGTPWCYLEFGNVRWCSDPARLEGRLRAAGVALVGHGGGARRATLMRAAHTNGELFLALPANGVDRNSINDPGSLLSVLCGGAESATACRGPTAAEAEFRTQGGTTPRLAGLLLIAIGALGMFMLLGFIALHLLGAEILSLFYLLLAPAAVIAPALGDGGRAAFRIWGTRLLGAVCSKLIFSFLLGVVLLMTRTLIGLEALGWWTRWLLVAALWWGAYGQRHQVLGVIAGQRPIAGGHRGTGARHHPLTRLVKEQLEGPRTVWHGVQRVRSRRSRGAPEVERRAAHEPLGVERAVAVAGARAAGDARTIADAQVWRLLEHDHAAASGPNPASVSDAQHEVSNRRAQLQRIRAAQTEAATAGDTRRTALLNARAERVEGEVARGQRALEAGERAARHGGRPYTAGQLRERSEWLDAQAALPPARSRGDGSEHSGDGSGGGVATAAACRDYPSLAGLVGYGRQQYEQLHPREQREARLKIDRELEQRLCVGGHAPHRLRDRPFVRERSRDTPPHQRRGAPVPPPRRPDPPRRSGGGKEAGAGGVRGGGADTIGGGFDSPVMRDAYEVMRRRKRQLGG
jgi:hypothetical protein